MKKLIFSITAVVIGVSLILGATMAWFTDTANVGSATFQAGTVSIDATGPIGLTAAEQNNINPGDTITAEWGLVNTGSKAIRLLAEIDIAVALPLAPPGFVPDPNVIKLDCSGSQWNILTGGWDTTSGHYKLYAEFAGSPLAGFQGVVPGSAADGAYAGASGGNNQLTFGINALLKGPETTNAYQGASITLSGTVYAVQAANYNFGNILGDLATFKADDLNGSTPAVPAGITLNGTAYTSLQAAVDAASDGDTVYMGAGIYQVPGTVNVNKAITIQGAGNLTVIETSGTVPALSLSRPATIDGIYFKKLDHANQNIVMAVGGSSGFTITDCKFTGVTILGVNGETTRAFKTNAGIVNYTISNNYVADLRQPSYIEGGGTITGNYVTGTRGWVICQNYPGIILQGNTFGNNFLDFAIIVNGQPDSGLYNDVAAISAANNGAKVENQLTTPYTWAQNGVVILSAPY